VIGSLAEPGSGDRPPLDYVIVITGGEILQGLHADSHIPFLTRVLRPLGASCVGALTVDDRETEVASALQFAVKRAPLVIVTGGLGPTPNDITREAISTFTGIPLREEEEVVAGMERRFQQPRDQLRPNLRRQALVPGSGGYLPNSAGTAVGLVFDTTNTTVIALPGPPRELQPMVERELVPYLQRRFGVRRPGSSLTLRFVGLGQSQISQTLQDRVRLPSDLVITSQFEAGRVDFTFALPGETESEKAWLETLAGTLRREFGDHLYAEDNTTLEDRWVGELAMRGWTMVLIEIGTGGHISESLAQARNVDRVLVGSLVASSQPRLGRLLAVELDSGAAVDSLDQLARVVRSRARADLAVILRLSDQKEREPRTVQAIWLGTDRREAVFPWTDSSTASNALLTTRVLDWLRRQLRPPAP
jgi:nicotinamide-nucleotide amidase